MATTINRYPLSQRFLRQPSVPSPNHSARTVSGTKRPRSPGISTEEQSGYGSSKRARAAASASATTATPTSKRSRTDRKQQEAEFREKYCRLMPTWVFHFSEIGDDELVKAMTRRLVELGSTVDDFFSIDITHFICRDSNLPSKLVDGVADKENRSTGLVNSTKLKRSPSKQTLHTTEGQDPLSTARCFNKKIWDIKKLDSVLSRCLLQPLLLNSAGTLISRPVHSAPNTKTGTSSHSLTKLLQSEKLHGTTERDPTQKRRDYTYFSRGSYFVLVEDMRQELATIAVQEYSAPKRDSGKTPWPVLYCHPKSRGPFIQFDERERKRWEKTRQMEQEEKNEQEQDRRRKMKRFEEALRRKREAVQNGVQKGGDLRRSVSMNNLRRRETVEDNIFIDFDGDGCDIGSANASGYLASGNGGYVAASGNSVHITSTTGTTSAAGYSFGRKSQLPPSLRAIANQEIVTSRKTGRGTFVQKGGEMGPPLAVPENQRVLRKSKSTNTLRLGKREEGSKPGYCESCRVKFEDFKQHIVSSRHRKFAMNDANFSQLDYVLDRVRRTTVQEIQNERNGTHFDKYTGLSEQRDSEDESNDFFLQKYVNDSDIDMC